MSDTRTTKQLFRAWRRKGDAEAGQIMAQRVADWYYAIATSRLGERAGREPCEKACAQFGEGVAKMTEYADMVAWARGLILAEVIDHDRIHDGNEPSHYTAKKKPKNLLVHARDSLRAEVGLLDACYSGRVTGEELEALALPLGGMPIGILHARYKVKAWLAENAEVPFAVLPTKAVLDRAPMPLYESARMANAEEEKSFEHWMLSDAELCRDIAEFSHFAIALRGGLPEAAPEEHIPPAPTPSEDVEDDDWEPPKKSSVGPIAIVGLGLAVLFVLLGTAAAVLFVVLNP